MYTKHTVSIEAQVHRFLLQSNICTRELHEQARARYLAISMRAVFAALAGVEIAYSDGKRHSTSLHKSTGSMDRQTRTCSDNYTGRHFWRPISHANLIPPGP